MATLVWYYDDNGGWRTGKELRTVNRGKKRNLVEIEPSCDIGKRRVYVRPERVTVIKGGE